jgi:hypothetical protein
MCCTLVMRMVMIPSALLCWALAPVLSQHLSAGVSVFAAGAPFAVAAAAYVVPEMASSDATLQPVGTWDPGCCSYLAQIHYL